MTYRTTRLRSGPSVVLLLLSALAMLSGGRLHAQGTDGAVPDPITSAELRLYADRLGLSEQQRSAIDRMHEQYSTDFLALRDGEIQEFLDSSRRMFTTFMFNPDAGEAQRMLDKYTRLDARVKAIDDGLFDRMQTVLTADQAMEMERVRQMRERLRYRAGVNRIVSFANPGVAVDVSAIVHGLNFPDELVRRIEPSLHAYEMQVTARLRRFNDATGKMMVGMVSVMEEMMAGVDLQQNPRQLMGRFEQMQEAMADIARPALEEASEVVRTNRRTVRTLIDTLPVEQGRQVEYAFLRAAYPQVFEGIWESMSRYEIALARYAENAPLRQQIQELREAMDARHRPLTDQMMDVWDEQRREMPAMPMGRRGRPATAGGDDRLERLSERRGRVNAQGIEALLAVIGLRSEEELTDGSGVRISPPTATTSPRGQRAPRAVNARRFATSTAFADAIRPAPGQDELLPGAIDEAEFAWYSAMLGFDAVDAAIVSAVHRDYVEAFQTYEEEHVRPFVDRVASGWRFDARDGSFSAPTESQIAAIYAERAEHLAALKDLDAGLFADLELFLPSDAVDRLDVARRARLRTVYNRSFGGAGPARGGGPLAAFRQGMRGGMGMTSNDREESIDLTRLIELIDVSDSVRSDLRERLRRYDLEITEAFRKRYELMVEMFLGTEQLAAVAAAAQQGGGRFDWSVMMRGDVQGRMETMASQSAQARARVVELNRGALASLDDADEVRELYRRAAFPGVYRDPENAEGSLLAALELESLTFDQREEIGDLLLDFRGPYNSLSERMIELESSDEPEDADRMSRWQQRQAQRSSMERLRFERSELSERTIRRLMAMLTEAQRGELGLIER